jgi:phthalate 4,5-dioxygenase oxygenase subunit
MLNANDNELLCRVGPGTPGGEWLRRFWMPTLLSSQLPEPDCEPVEVRILGEDLVAFRDTEGRIGMMDALCPHRQAPMFYGRNEENGLRCVYHGWKFDVNGECVDMPSEPADSKFHEKVKPKFYPTREWANIVWTYMGPPALMPDLPQVEFARVPDENRFVTKYRHNGNWVQAMEGDADSSHVGFLHKNLNALRGDPATMDPQQRYTTLDQAPKWTIEPKPYGMQLAARRNAEEDSYYWRINQWLLPFYTFIAGNLDQRRGHCHIWVPVDDEWTDTWDVIWGPSEALTEQERYNMTQGPNAHISSLDEKTLMLKANVSNHFFINRDDQRNKSFTGIAGIREQDAAVTTGMGAIVNRTREHLGTSDMAIVVMRRLLLKGIKELMSGTEPYAAAHPEELRVRSWSYVLPRTSDFATDPEVKRLSTTLVP